MKEIRFLVSFRGLLVLLVFFSVTSLAAAEKVVLQLKWKHQFQFAGYYAAVEKGFYKEAGLEVELKENDPGQDSVQKVLDGKADFGVGSTELLLKRQNGDPIVVLSVIFQHSPLGLLMLKNDQLQSIHDLAGKKVMIEKGSSELFAYLNKENVPAGKFTLLPHSFHTEDLMSGSVDAMSVYVTDELFEVKRSGKPYILYSPRSVGIDFYGDNLFTTETVIKKDPKVVKAFREASLKGWTYAMKNPDEIIELIYSKYSKRHSLEHLKFEADQMIPLLRTDLIQIGHINPGRWKHIALTYAELGMMNADIDVSSLIYDPNPKPKDLSGLYFTIAMLFLILFLIAFIAVYIFRKNSELKIEIYERKLAEETMKKMQATIEKNSKLESLGVLAGGIAHDFNNLLAGVFGYVEMALGRSKDDKTAEYLIKAMRSMDKARELTSQLITFSKGGTPLKQVRELFPFVQESVEFSLRMTPVKCSFNYPQDLWKSEYDEDQLRDVLKNIVSNAHQAYSDVKLAVLGENVEVLENEVHDLNAGKYVKITLGDNGPGMEPDVLDKIFDPFFTTKESGHGLGLSKCYSIIKQHSGTIEAESRKDAGTTFFIYLPAHID